MVATPEYEAPPEELVDLVNNWYDTHRETYQWVWSQLDEMQKVWVNGDHQTRIGLLKGSFIFTLFTQRVVTDLAEESFLRVIEGDSVPTALSETGAGFHHSKTAKIYQSFWDDDLWDAVVDMIAAGQIDTAHQALIDNPRVKGVATAKAAFVLANVGLTQKMCINSNVARLLGQEYEITGECTSNDDCKEKYPDLTAPKCIGGSCVSDPAPTTSKVDKYESLCADVQQFFPDLSRRMEPYHLQWLLFDLNRHFRFGDRTANPKQIEDMTVPGTDAVATHTVWFDTAINRPERVASRMRTVTKEADAVFQVFANDPKYADFENLSTATSRTHFGSDEMERILKKAEAPDPPLITKQEETEIIQAIEQAAEDGVRRRNVGKIRDDVNAAIDRAVEESN